MHRTSMFGILMDPGRSKGSYLYDLRRDEWLLDLFGMYSSLPLGYNHPIFAEERFREEMLEAAAVKVANCEMATPAAEKFLAAFSGHPSMAPFKYFHFACTGALAIEAAIKAAIDYRRAAQSRVVNFRESFHGINSYGGIVTDRFGSVRQRLEGLPGAYWEPLENPVIRFEDGVPVMESRLTARVLEQVRTILGGAGRDNVAAVLVEPIQCTAGDLYFDQSFLKGLRTLCTEFDVPLIFDEIQTGFGGTGTMWYFEQCDFVPDIVAFGKKTQTSGIMVREQYGAIFQRPLRLEVTWDGDLLDMIRCRYVLEAYQRFDILENVRARGAEIAKGLSGIPGLRNVRQRGLLIAFDFDTTEARDAYVRGMRQERTLVLSTQALTVRWRPHLAVSADDVETGLERTRRVLDAG